MPLSELYRLAKRRVDSTQELEPTNDVFELVWENGQITTTQGQSSRGKKDSQSLPSQTPKPGRAGKFEVPMSEEVGLSQNDDEDEDMIPWLTYQMDCPDLLPEISGVTAAAAGEISTQAFSKLPGFVRSKTATTTTTTSPGVINFSHFSRPAAKANARIGADLRLSERGSRRPEEKNAAASSSVCSGNTLDTAVKRKLPDAAEDSECHSEDADEESFGGKKTGLPRTSPGSKRSRAAEVHNLSERRRRDRINEKMRALQELIPNCNKVDKASMLDEAIEYLKTLQLQVQIMSMGAGLCMPQMMMSHMHMPHFPPMPMPMGMGMGMGGFGMGIPDMSGGGAAFPGPHFPGPPMAGPGLQVFGLPSQGISMPMPMPRPYVGPAMTKPENTENKTSMNLTSAGCQATKESIERSASILTKTQLPDVNTRKASASTTGNDAVPSREASYG